MNDLMHLTDAQLLAIVRNHITGGHTPDSPYVRRFQLARQLLRLRGYVIDDPEETDEFPAFKDAGAYDD